MAKHLTTKDIEIFVKLIHVWEGKLTWEALCDEGAKLIGSRPTRQTLSAHERIMVAYQGRKKSGFTPTRRPASLSIAEQRIRALEGENSCLQDENYRLLEQFQRWQYNAYKRGVSAEVLDAPLPWVDRDSSEG